MRHDRSSSTISASFRWRPGQGGAGTALGLSAAVAALIGAPGIAHADYRLMFVTSDGISATSSDIGTYNSFAATEAGLNALFPSTTWSAVASTASVSAVTNVDCGSTCDSSAPIYLPSGVEVADSTNDMFAGAFSNAPYQNQFGATPASAYVWTGSNTDGTAFSYGNGTDATMGDVSTLTALGNATGGAGSYLGDAATDGVQSDLYPIYVISGDLPGSFPGSFAVPAPEPADGAALLLGGLIVTGIFRHRRSRGTPHQGAPA